MSIFLKLFSLETLIATVIAYLASTVKNPTSPKTIQLRYIVNELRKATTQFLVFTGGIPGDEGPLPPFN